MPKAGDLRRRVAAENGRLKLTSSANIVAEGNYLEGNEQGNRSTSLLLAQALRALPPRIQAHEIWHAVSRSRKGGITNSILHFPMQMIFFTTPELLEIGGVPLVSEREKPHAQRGAESITER